MEWKATVSCGQIYLTDPSGYTVAKMTGYSFDRRLRKAVDICNILNGLYPPPTPAAKDERDE